jgi:thioredoxin-like negative regulator of GroEL
MALVMYFGMRSAKRSADANKLLDQASLHLDSSAWPYPVIKYLKQEMALAELLGLANDQDKQTEAHAYAGLQLALNGDRSAALEHLRWVRDNGNKSFVEFPLALAELESLEKVPAESP